MSMNLHVLFIQRKEPYPGAYAPKALVTWTEYAIEENPQGFEDDCAANLKAAGDDVIAHEVILIEVNQDAIRERLLGQVTLKGRIVPATE